MALKVALAVAIVLCLRIATISGQSPTIAPLVIEGQVGETVMFDCTAISPLLGEDLAIEVFNDVANTFVGATVGGRLTRMNNGQFANFTYRNLEAADNNTMFRCATSRDTSASAVISVIFAPIITRVSPVGDPITVREGEAITVELNVSANPQPSFYEWRNDTQRVVTGDDGITVSLNSIVFNPALRQYSGLYRLVANNSAGSSEYNFTLDVQHPPVFPSNIVSPDTSNCSTDGEVIMCASYPGVSVTFLCNAIGNPLPTVSRSVAAVADELNIDRVTGRNININSVNPNNAGIYNCTATSGVLSETVTISRTIRFYVGGVARALSDVEVMIGSGSVTVSWSYDNSRTVNPVPAQYFIATVSQDGIQIGAPFMINVDTTSITIPGTLLQPESTYTVSVVVRNLQGDSEAVSESITIPAGFNNAVVTSMSYVLGLCALMLTVLLS